MHGTLVTFVASLVVFVVIAAVKAGKSIFD